MAYDAENSNPQLKNQKKSDDFTRSQFSRAYAKLDEMFEKGLIDQNEYDSTKINLKDL